MANRPAKSVRAENALARREAIVAAALDVFVEKGFAAARMEDIARWAGVAKGTIYLHFSDKEALFEAIVRQEIRPRLDAAALRVQDGIRLEEFLGQVFMPVFQDVANTRRGAVIRLLIGESGRFPKLAEVYYRVVVEPGIALMSKVARRALERGELRDDTLVRFPQLMVAPIIFTVVWKGLFERFRHLDAEQMARAYFDRLLPMQDEGKKKKEKSRKAGK